MAGFRRIQILQTTVVEFGAEGQLNAYAWEMQPGARLVLQSRPLSFVSALGHGHEGRWCSGFAQGLLVELRRYYHQRRQLTPVRHVLPTYVLWLVSRMSAHLAQTMEMAPMHLAIEQALLCNPNAEGRSDARRGLNAAVLALAKKRLRLAGHHGRLAPTLKDYQDYQRCLQNNAY